MELEPIRLEVDSPVTGVVRDEAGEPIAGATVGTFAGYEPVETDASGSFTIGNLPVRPWFPIKVRKDGYVGVINRPIYVSKEGYSWLEEGPDDEAVRVGPFADLVVTLQAESWIEGRAVDAETGAPVALTSIVLCSVSRDAAGEPVLSGCHVPGFSQPEPGRFRVPYRSPTEYHLTLSADGYRDAEAYTPRVDALRPIEGIDVAMGRKADAEDPRLPTQHLDGHATRDGRPVASGWAAFGRVHGPGNLANVRQQRGRTVPDEFSLYQSVPIRDGAFELEVPHQDDRWYVLVEEAGHEPTIVGPVAVGRGERKRLDVECVAGGSIAGRVRAIDETDQGSLWVVAFSDLGTRAEARVAADGRFLLLGLPAGRHGLKVGHDAFQDAEIPPRVDFLHTREAFERLADPWARAEVVIVSPGSAASGVVLTAPDTPDRLDPGPAPAPSSP